MVRPGVDLGAAFIGLSNPNPSSLPSGSYLPSVLNSLVWRAVRRS